MIITPAFTANFDANFGPNAAAARSAWIAAANVFAGNFADDIHVNIAVDAVPGSDVFGESMAGWISTTYDVLRTQVVADATTPDDNTAIGAGGSMVDTDPTDGAGTWWLTRAQAKALGLIPDDTANDGTTTFGAGIAFTFSGPIAAGTYDFQGVAAHEISEIMGRVGLAGSSNDYSLIDNYSYTDVGTKGLVGGPGNYFSIDDGNTLIKLWNDPTANGLDSRDWAPGSDDAFNQFSSPGVVNPVSDVDLQLLDVIGYDLSPGQAPVSVAATIRRFGVGVARKS